MPIVELPKIQLCGAACPKEAHALRMDRNHDALHRTQPRDCRRVQYRKRREFIASCTYYTDSPVALTLPGWLATKPEA
jgi:hypothetical protein